MAAYGSGDLAAAAPLARRHAPRVLAVAQRMLADPTEAEDVTQEALLRLWKIAPDWQPGRAKVSTWLFRVVANLCTDRIRRRRDVPLDTHEGSVADPAPTSLLDSQRHDALQAALDKLPERQRLAVILRHIQELSNPEIAQSMEISVEAVESLTSRGRAALSRLLVPSRDALGYQDD